MIQQISKIKKQSREWEKLAREKLTLTEEQYISDPTSDRLRVWIEAQQNYRLVTFGKVENRQIFQRQVGFGESENVGRMLAHLVEFPFFDGANDRYK